MSEDLPTIERVAEEHARTQMTGAERRLAEKGTPMITDPGLAREAARLLRELLARLDARPQTAPFVRAACERIGADAEELARLMAALSPDPETR